MPIVECPHCYTKVLLKSDGSCPSCGKDSNSQSDADPEMTTAQVDFNEPLPPFCVLCAQSTKRTVTVFRGEDPDQEGLSEGKSLVVGLLAGWRIAREMGTKQTMELVVPVCRDCRKRRDEFKPRHVNHGQQRATLLVHRSFKAKLHQLRRM